MREFGSEPEQPAEEEPAAEMPAEEVPVVETPEAPSDETREAPDETAVPEDKKPVTSDTVRLERIPDATIRLEKVPDVKGTVRNAQPILEEDLEEDFAQSQMAPEETKEPYSEEWEPEYEQPISEYGPPQPIPFPPRSRMQELKKKLVAGPERRYYKLSEAGSGKMQVAIFVNMLILVLTAVCTILYHTGAISESRLRLMVFGQLFCMLFAALMGSNQLVEGVADIVCRRFSLNSLLVFSFFFCCIDAILGLKERRIPCCAAFSLQMTMSLWNAYHVRNTELGQLDTMRKATKLDSLSTTEDYCDGRKGILRGEGQVEDFMDTYYRPSKQEKVVSVYALVALGLSLVAGIVAGIVVDFSAGIQVAAVTTLAAAPATMHVFQSRPMAILERRLHEVGTVLCGWQGVKGLSGKVAFPVDHRDLFPSSTVKMNGVKFFGNRNPDQIIAYATALVVADDGVLAPLFVHLLEKRNGRHYTAERLEVFEGKGLRGEVDGTPVLAGSLSFMKSMDVEVPDGLRVGKAVYVALEGKLCGLFAITYEKERFAAAGFGSLCSYGGVEPVLTGGNFVLTSKFLFGHFGVNPKRLRFTTPEERAELAQKQLPEDAPTYALVTGKSLAAYAYAVTGARTLRTAVNVGLAVHMIGGILGIAMMGVLAALGATNLLTPVNLFLYELVWMVPGLLITEWTRSI